MGQQCPPRNRAGWSSSALAVVQTSPEEISRNFAGKSFSALALMSAPEGRPPLALAVPRLRPTTHASSFLTLFLCLVLGRRKGECRGLFESHGRCAGQVGEIARRHDPDSLDGDSPEDGLCFRDARIKKTSVGAEAAYRNRAAKGTSTIDCVPDRCRGYDFNQGLDYDAMFR